MRMISILSLCLAAFYGIAQETNAPMSNTSEADRASVILVVGAPGDKEYEDNFKLSASLWQEASRKADAKLVCIGLGSNPGTNDYALLQQSLSSEFKEGRAELWLVLLGHGTFKR